MKNIFKIVLMTLCLSVAFVACDKKEECKDGEKKECCDKKDKEACEKHKKACKEDCKKECCKDKAEGETSDEETSGDEASTSSEDEGAIAHTCDAKCTEDPHSCPNHTHPH